MDEVADMLGTGGPRLEAARLHPWVWEPAARLWDGGHHREAVQAAATSLVLQTQAKAGRHDVTDKALYEQTFTLAPATPGKSRLRVREPDGTDTYRSTQEGVMNLGKGLSQAVRNVASHTTDAIEEQDALERLAALSMLARFIDAAEIEEA
ncbi:TIGR02391 family protein [Cellulosimicrobium funkei]|uniref:TIGR02391 family protein n=1 Tax=Cellulosimicrobium funkei TaxID=264251 RepID=UPI0037DBF455